MMALLLVLAPALAGDLYGQDGGRRREPKSRQRGKLFFGKKSKGHADEFAKGNSGRKGRLARLFRRDRGSWQYRKSGTPRSNERENRFLFRRHRSQGRQDNAATQERQKRERAKDRRHGNDTFKSRKHKR